MSLLHDAANPVERTLTTVRLRTDRTKGWPVRETARAVVVKLVTAAECRRCRLDGPDRRAKVMRGVRPRAGAPIQGAEDHAAA